MPERCTKPVTCHILCRWAQPCWGRRNPSLIWRRPAIKGNCIQHTSYCFRDNAWKASGHQTLRILLRYFWDLAWNQRSYRNICGLYT
jgi:hypothetical protein